MNHPVLLSSIPFSMLPGRSRIAEFGEDVANLLESIGVTEFLLVKGMQGSSILAHSFSHRRRFTAHRQLGSSCGGPYSAAVALSALQRAHQGGGGSDAGGSCPDGASGSELCTSSGTGGLRLMGWVLMSPAMPKSIDGFAGWTALSPQTAGWVLMHALMPLPSVGRAVARYLLRPLFSLPYSDALMSVIGGADPMGSFLELPRQFREHHFLDMQRSLRYACRSVFDKHIMKVAMSLCLPQGGTLTACRISLKRFSPRD